MSKTCHNIICSDLTKIFYGYTGVTDEQRESIKNFINKDKVEYLQERVAMLKKNEDVMFSLSETNLFKLTPKKLETFYEEIVNVEKLDQFLKEQKSKLKIKEIYSIIFDSIKSYADYSCMMDLLQIKQDPFAKECVFKKIDTQLTLVRPFRFLPEEIETDLSKEEIEEIWQDYQEHNKYIKKLIKWNISCIFASDGRPAHMWLWCNAGFGKSALYAEGGIFDKLGLLVATDENSLYKALSGGTSKFTQEQFTSRKIISVDEFSKAGRELKGIDNYIQMNPKYKHRFLR